MVLLCFASSAWAVEDVCGFRTVYVNVYKGVCRREPFNDRAFKCYTRMPEHQVQSVKSPQTNQMTQKVFGLCANEGDACEDEVHDMGPEERGICQNHNCVSLDHTLHNSLWCNGEERYLYIVWAVSDINSNGVATLIGQYPTYLERKNVPRTTETETNERCPRLCGEGCPHRVINTNQHSQWQCDEP